MEQSKRAENYENIKILEEQLRTISMPVLLKMQKMDVLKYLKDELVVNKNNLEACCEMDAIANNIIDIGYRNISKVTEEEQKEIYNLIKKNYQFLGRRHFKEFMISIEWDFAPDMKFYDIRKIVFDEWIQELEKLEYGVLEGLSISAPPRTGKTRNWYNIFYVVYVKASRKKLFFCITYWSNG